MHKHKLVSLFGWVVFFAVSFSAVFLIAIGTSQAEAVTTATCQTGFDRPLLFGVNPNPGSASALETVPDTGSTIGQVSVHWDRIEPAAGQVNTEEYNFPIRKWEETNLVLTVNLSGTPEWAKDNPALPVWKAQPRRDDAQVKERFENLVYTMVSTNKDKVKHWSYWNEPNGCMSNMSTGECGNTSGTASDYVYWLNIFYDQVKRADPEAIVIGGNLEMIKNIDQYVGYMNSNNAKYDWLGVNPYHKNCDCAIPLDWISSAYNKQSVKKPVFLNEWGFDSNWSGMDEDRVKQRITEAFSELIKDEYSWIIGAAYHNVRDVDDEEGLRDENGLRPRGVEFKRISDTVCNPQFGEGGGAPVEPPVVPPSDGEIPIVIRTHFTADQFPGEGPAEVSLFLNNGKGYNTSAHPYDDSACTSAGGGCGTPNRYSDKLVENFQVTGTSFVKDITINASQLVTFPHPDIGMTKLSYAFHNDRWDANLGDRNVRITKIEFFGPGNEKLLEYNKDTNSHYGGYPTNHNELIRQSFYFDKGIINNSGVSDSSQDGMVKAFDKQEIQTIVDQDVRSQGYWDLGSEGSFNVVSSGIHKAILDKYGGLKPASCVIATNDLGNFPLRNNEFVNISAVASVEIEKFTYSFYNLDNTNDQGIPRPFCVEGKAHTNGCPAGSGQLKLTITDSTNIDYSPVQAFSQYRLPNNQLATSMWIVNQGWTQYGTGSFAQTDITTQKGQGEIHARDSLPAKDGVQIWFWRGPKRYSGFVPYNSDGSGLSWSGVEIKEDLNINQQPNIFPGSGYVIAQTSVPVGGVMYEFLWRQDGRGFFRTVPLKNDGLPNWSGISELEGHGFTFYKKTTDLPGSGRMQAHSLALNETGDKVIQSIWRGDKLWMNEIPIVNDVPMFDQATTPVVQGDGTGPTAIDGVMSYAAATLPLTRATVLKPDTNESWQGYGSSNTAQDRIPKNLQVNVTFNTKSGGYIGNDANCTTSFKLNTSIQGDINNDCQVDMLDFNAFRRNYNKFNCNVNLTGDDCMIDLQDFNVLRDGFDDSCQ